MIALPPIPAFDKFLAFHLRDRFVNIDATLTLTVLFLFFSALHCTGLH